MKIKSLRVFYRLSFAVVLCACLAFFVSTCKDDEECKKCEHKTIEGRSATFCDDELKEAERSDSDWKNCK